MGMKINFSFGEKPTAHQCICNVCTKKIRKGQYRFEICAYGYKQSASRFYHSICFLKEVKIMLKGKKKDKWLEGVFLGIRLMEP